MRVLVIFLLFGISGAAAQPAKPSGEARRVQDFLNRTQPVCQFRPARACVEAGWRFAASRPGRGLTLTDVERLHRRLKAWYGWRQASLSAQERLSIGLGLLLAGGIGMGRLHGAFDANGDGIVTRSELLAEIRLDKRPLGAVLSDPAAVDRAGLARRLKLAPALLGALFR